MPVHKIAEIMTTEEIILFDELRVVLTKSGKSSFQS